MVERGSSTVSESLPDATQSGNTRLLLDQHAVPKARVVHADIRRWSIAVAILAMIGGALATVILCLKWSGNLDIKHDISDDICRWGISVSTLLCVAALWRYYSLYWREAWQRKHASALAGRTMSRATLWHSPRRIKGMLFLETAVLLVQPLPLLNLGDVLLCDLCMLMAMRLWFLARALRDSNPEHLAAVQQRKMLGALVSHQTIPWTFALRATFKRKPWVVMASVAGVGMGFFSVFVWVAERGEQGETFNLFESFWFIGVTMTTVGYGDRSPKSVLGKMIALTACIFGINATALLVTTIINTFTLNLREKYLISSIEMSHAHRAEREAAARIIQFSWQNRNFVRNGQVDSNFGRMLKHGRAVRFSVVSSSLVGELRRCRHQRKAVCEDLRAADFQRDTTNHLEQLSRGQDDIMARLGKIEQAISQLAASQAVVRAPP